MIRCTWHGLSTLILALGMALWSSSCTRAASDMSTVSLQLPSYSQSQGVNSKSAAFNSSSSSLSGSCNPCLKSITVHVDGDEFKTISFKQKHSSTSQIGTELDTAISLEVPGGNNRRIQILALYIGQVTGSDMVTASIQYGSTTVNLLSAEPPPIVLKLASIGAFIPATIAGRYLTQANAGPTGIVDISYEHPSSGLVLQMPSGEVVNGWFKWLASENIPLTYKLNSSGAILMSKMSTNTVKNNVTSAAHVVHFTRPKVYYYDDGSSGANFKMASGGFDIVYGFFSANSSLLNGKKVCVQNNSPATYATSYASLYTEADPNSVSNRNILYHHQPSATGSPPHIYATGGATAAACGSFLNNKLYTSDQISIFKDQFAGKGNDMAIAISGVFTAFAEEGIVQKYKFIGTYNNPTYTIKAMAGLFSPTGTGISGSNLFDGIRLFKTATPFADDIRCSEKWLQENAFIENPVTSSNIQTGGEIEFSTTLGSEQSESTLRYIVCPTRSGELQDIGGMRLGPLLRPPAGPLLQALDISTPIGSSLFLPNIMVSHSIDKIITLKNIGSSAAENITLTSTAAELVVNNINCPAGANFLAVDDSCTVRLTITPIGVGPLINTALVVSYNQAGAGHVETRLDITATAIPEQANLIASSATIVLSIPNLAATPSTAQPITLTNVTGTGRAENIIFSLTGADPTAFTVLSQTCGNINIPIIMEPLFTCDIQVVYQPSVAAVHNATLAISYESNGQIMPQKLITLTGEAGP
ncbi:hypothetical protein [Pseudobdellovibrio exovorus]|uniref:Abnormal spindle-like microcephaly-associated protein ASH domain-containing protein n=1 Tax=Pseudobdellovibrio exovorus JSS TaxID=1184267 RepID=M4V836_9BACT|nr:hypothetical protein [Pseudobdellovibrio exovorus]AGH94605.1 hypothetical protein A11Q_385 [Pseudobdellovibrio exovorus JSS]